MPYEGDIKVYVHSTEQNLRDHKLSHLIPSTNQQVHLFCNIETTTTTTSDMKPSNNNNNNNNNNVSMEDPFVFTDEGFQDLILLQPMNKKTNSSHLSTTMNPWKKMVPDVVVNNKSNRDEEEYKSSLEPISLTSLSLHKVPLSPKRNTQRLKRVRAHHEFNTLYEDTPKASMETRKTTKKRNQNSALFTTPRDCSYQTTNVWDQYIDIEAPPLLKRHRLIY